MGDLKELCLEKCLMGRLVESWGEVGEECGKN